jgi:hypothetical protein
MDKAFDWLGGLLVVAGIFVMVRPNSQGPSLVSNVTGGISNMVKAATGGGTW